MWTGAAARAHDRVLAKFKREREEFSKTKDAAEEPPGGKELDEIKADRDAKALHLELENLAAERQTAARS